MSGQSVSTRAGARTALSAAALSALTTLPLAAHAGTPGWLLAFAAHDAGVCLASARPGPARVLPRSFALKPVAAASSSALCGAGARVAPATGTGSYADIVNDIAIVEWRTGDETSPVFAVGILGDKRTRSILNRGSVDARATASVDSFDPTISLSTGGDVTESLTVSASAIGIAGGAGQANITNTGTVAATATATVDQVAVTLTLAETAHVSATTAITATAVGIDGGDAAGGRPHEGSKGHSSGGSDGGHGGSTLRNDGSVLADATASSTDVAVTVSGFNFATADTAVSLDAKATGIRAGASTGSIVNTGSVTAISKAELIGVEVGASFADLSIFDRASSDVSTTLRAGAIGIDARDAKKGANIDSTGSVSATATSFVNSTGVSIGSEGVSSEVESLFTGPIAKADITATGRAAGVRSGVGDDTVSLAGSVTVVAGATAQQQNVDVGIGVFDLHIPTPGFSVVGAGTKASAEAAGVATDGGNDRIVQGAVTNVNASAQSSVVVVSATLADLAIDPREDLPSLPIGYEVLVVDGISKARAGAVGIDAGKGDDTILNSGSGNLAVGATAKAGSVDVTARAGLKFEDSKKPDPSKASVSAEFGVQLARASIDAKSAATGIDGGEGHDTIVNDGVLGATATTETHAVLVRFDLMGPLDFDQGDNPSLLASAAASDTSNSATATAAAVAGGAGDDEIVNRGQATASATATALNVSAGLSVKLEKNGALAGVVLIDSDATATARAVGLDGGAGTDRIENTGRVDSTAGASATSVSATLEVQSVSDKGLAAGVSVLDADTTASATAVGLRSGDTASVQGDKHDAAADTRRSASSGETKACANASVHTGCTPPAPAPELRNAGIVKVDADAANVAVNATAHVNIAKQGAAVGVALSDTSATTIARATGIEGDGTGERVVNDGTIGLTATSNAVSVGVNLTVEGSATGLAAGATLTRSSVDASATVTGIAGGGGDDEILNTGSIATQSRNVQDPRNVQANATTVSVGIEPTVVTKTGAAIGAALTDTRATSNATAIGIDGGEGDDKVVNRGDITLATIGSDTTAVGVALELALAKQGFTASAALARADATSTATVAGIAGGAGDDTLVNEKQVTLRNVKSDSNAVSVSLDISGAQDGLVIGAALADAGAASTTTAAGLAGGDGRDTLANRGTVRIEDIAAESDAVGVSVDIKIAKNGLGVGAALVKSGVASTAEATGLSGGAGNDTLVNDGDIDILRGTANADAVGVSVALAASSNGVNVAAGLADGSSSATASGRGLAGGAGDDLAVNRGHIGISGLRAGGSAASVSLGLAGANNGISASAALADSSATAIAGATGIDGGEGHDELWNMSGIAIGDIKAQAIAVSADVAISGTLSAGVAAGAALGRASATAEATAVGVDGGAGNDRLANKADGHIVIDDVGASTTAVGVSVQLGVVSNGAAIGAALVDTSTTARATAVGLQGGLGDDVMSNAGELTLQNIHADALAVSVSVTGNAALNAGVAAGAALVDGKGTAQVRATGMDGGAGDDTLVNEGDIKTRSVEAVAHATGVSVALNLSLAGGAAGASITDSSANALTVVHGLDGAAGNDRLVNRGTVDVQGKASADSVGVSVTVSGALGPAVGASIADASSTARADVFGVDAGEGDDTTLNEGSVTADASAVANGTSVSIVVPNIFGGYSAATLASSATAHAVGLNDADSAAPAPCGHGKQAATGQDESPCGRDGHGGKSAMPTDRDGGDGHGGRGATLANAGSLIATATATATGTSVSGALFGYSLGDVGNTALAEAAGVRSGARDDSILNEGSLTAGSAATASGLTVSVTVAGTANGQAETTAVAQALGIDSGAGDDLIDNRAGIVATARSNASAGDVTVGLFGNASSSGSGDASAAKTARASATGIAGGDGDDTIVSSGSVRVDAGRAALRPDTQRDGSCTAEAGGACASASSVTVSLAGRGKVDAGTSAIAQAVGLDGGRGDDRVDNTGLVRVEALARSRTGGAGVTVFGVNDFKSSTLVSATVSGIAGGDGADHLANQGTIEAEAAADTYASNTAVVIGGVATAEGNTQAATAAAGIDGGAGDDTLVNTGAASLKVAADAYAGLTGSSFSFAGSAPTRATVSAGATAVGLRGGSGADLLKNDGGIDIAAGSRVDVTGTGTAIFGGASADSNVTATATAIGIDGGDGEGDDGDAIVNRGRLGISADATLNATSTSFGFGNAQSNEVLFSVTHATGIDAGAGDNVVINDGTLTADAGSTLAASGGATTVFGNTSAAANVTARTFATGIAAGAGHDVIAIGVNGSLAVTGTLAASAGSSAEPGALFVDGKAASSAAAESAVIGIEAGEGDNRIVVEGSVLATLKGSATASTYADADFFSLDSDAFSNSTATLRPSRAVGVQTGAGRDRIANLGTITVNAKPEVTAAANADGGGLIDDDAYATATASASGLQAIGIDAGAGDNAILNGGTISVTAAPKATASAGSVAYGGSDSGAGATATIAGATAIGILASGRADQVVNEGTIGVHTNAQAQASGSTSPGSLVGGTNEFEYSVSEVRGAQAIGIWLRGPSSGVLNTGSIDVVTFASSLGYSDAAAYGLRIDGRASLADAGSLKVRSTADANDAPATRVANDGAVTVTSSAQVLFGASASGAYGVWSSGPSIVQNDGGIRATASVRGLFGSATAESHGMLLGHGRNSVANAGDIIASTEALGSFLFGGGSGKALAIGIGSGDGGSRIVNTGRIVADAVSNGEATSYGIRTGSGDDLIVNQGSIVATRTVGGVAMAGIAIDAGAGNDTVVLGDGSVTRGDIDLGAGTDVLTMRGATVIEGTVIDDGSRLLLQLNGNGSFGGTVPAAAIAKRGEGTFALASLPSVQRLEVQGGTLEVAGDYRFRADGQFQATINGDGTHGRLLLLGQAQLGGSYSVQHGSGPFVNGTSYELLRADGGFAEDTSFDRIELPVSTRLVSFRSAQQAGAFSVTADVKSFATVAAGGNAEAVARQLDRVLPAARGDLRNTLGTLQGLATDAEFATAYASLSPVTHGQRAIAGAASANRFGQALEQRLGALQVGARADAALAVPAASLASRLGAGALSLQQASESRQGKPYGLWVQAFAQKGDQDASGDVAGYGFDLAGRAIGMDHRFTDSFSAGAAFGWVNNEFRSDIAGNTADIDSRLFALYGSYTGEGFYASGTFSVGNTSYDSRRNIVVGATNTPVASQHDAKVIAATLGAGMPLRAGGGWVDPFASLHYTQIREDGFSESGGGSALAVEQRKTRSVVSELGVRWAQAYSASGNASVSPEASVAWLHDFGSGSRLINAAYLDAPDAAFAVEGQPIKRNGAKLGLGVTYRSGSGLTTQLRYSAEVRPGYRAHGIIGELRYEF
ncbi:autotransporter outer membrane beta-barrel domain-containing protein [Rhizobacter sp. AJA081-3]|uniref:autotransporter outer membrane beta-barrel domain-containing protein n=1 Tax=Rhizobacter sp. AJA081-3 TaxID=2753607 RepID=UPI001AE0DE35|nr:autotransporter outer membrane beta-barrel domain-containing protein [Rhizobacter sp. AJA081-3]QTN22134.1 autotransporter outer membrane beta-barrel domain-containing protein [Rhizobacter sp. AJA081-3]